MQMSSHIAQLRIQITEASQKCRGLNKEDHPVAPLHYTMPYYGSIPLYHTIYYTLLYCTILYYTTLYYTTLYYTILHYTILYYTILYNYTILYYTILHYALHHITLPLLQQFCAVPQPSKRSCSEEGLVHSSNRCNNIGKNDRNNRSNHIYHDNNKN